MMRIESYGWMVAGLLGIGAAVAMAPIGGGLEPPVGAVEDTSPSLAELQAQLSALNGVGAGGPWEVYNAPLTGNLTSVAGPLLIAEGRVHLHSIIGHRAHITAFDGAGQIDPSSFLTVSGQVAGRLTSHFSSGGSLSTDTVELDVVLENGLYLSYWVQNNNSHVTALYRRLD